MTHKGWVGMCRVALSCVALAACAGDADDSRITSGVTGTCVPNASLECYCPDGTVSTQICSQDGRSYSPCQCGGGGMAGGAAGMGGGAAGMGLTGGSGTGPGATGSPMAGTGAAGTMAGLPMAGMVGTSMTGGTGAMAGMGGTGGMAAAGMGGSAGGMASGEDVPDNEACAAVAMWDPAWAAFEEEVLELVNMHRAVGYNCDTQGQFGPAAPLTMNPYLRCSARLHSQDMADRNFFAHDNPDGEGPDDRMREVGYRGGTWGENIAMGQSSPQQVVQGWMESDGHCSNIMRPQFTEIGVGYVQGSSQRARYWTQNFGAACTGRWCM